jgi:hypothetical protein
MELLQNIINWADDRGNSTIILTIVGLLAVSGALWGVYLFVRRVRQRRANATVRKVDALVDEIEQSLPSSAPELRRDWELKFRASEILWPHLANDRNVMARRATFFASEYSNMAKPPRNALQTASPPGHIVEWLSEEWCRVFDAATGSRSGYVFEDGFSILFYAKILFADYKVLLRGQYDSSWPLQTTKSRALLSNPSEFDRARDSALRFLSDLEAHPLIKRAYPGGIPTQHVEAILQHYGFPTEFIDFTYSYDVALFFAEGAEDAVPAKDRLNATGAIYVIPPYAVGKEAALTTLPPQIARPSLQRGVFLKSTSEGQLIGLEHWKLIFSHKEWPIWNGLGSIPYESSIGLDKYLHPLFDPISDIASKYLATPRDRSIDVNPNGARLGDTERGVWFRELFADCLMDSGDKIAVDISLLVGKCKAEPKNAQFAMQMIADRMVNELGDKTLGEGRELADEALILGSLYAAYVVYRNVEHKLPFGEVPEELKLIVARYPVIMQCVSYVTSKNKDRFGGS